MKEDKIVLEDFYQVFNVAQEDVSPTNFVLKKVPSRSFLFEEKQRAHKLYFLIEGKVLLGRGLYEGKEKVIDLLMQPSLLGLEAIEKEAVFSVYAKTISEVRVLEIDGLFFNQCYRKNIKLHELVRNQMAKRLMRTEKKYFQVYGHSNFVERVKLFLVDVFVNHGKKVDESVVIQMNITHKELAHYLYVSRQSITTLLSKLKKAGIINYNRSQMELYNLDQLVSWEHK